MKDIQYEIVKEIAVLSTGDSGYTKELNLISWNGKEPKYDIRSFSPNREKCGNGRYADRSGSGKAPCRIAKSVVGMMFLSGLGAFSDAPFPF